MQSSFEADKHNFGKSVESFERGSGTWYRKPRSIFWEHFFFGTDSPLKSHFNLIGENGIQPLSSHFFNLEVEQKNDWIGFSKEVFRPVNLKITSDHFYSFGAVLGYCYAFGIRDLHKYNLVPTDINLQVIDAEVVLTDLVLPNETILLPFKEIPFSLSGISSLATSFLDLEPGHKERLLAGYFDVFATIFKSLDSIREICHKNIASGIPVRVILRNTGVYRNYLLEGTAIDGLLDEERVQLERGDIPYFFKRLGRNELLCIGSEAMSDSTVQSDLGLLKADVVRHAVDPQTLLKDQNLIEKKMVQGSFLIHRLLGVNGTNKFLWNGQDLVVGPDACQIEFTGHSFSLKA